MNNVKKILGGILLTSMIILPVTANAKILKSAKGYEYSGSGYVNSSSASITSIYARSDNKSVGNITQVSAKAMRTYPSNLAGQLSADYGKYWAKVQTNGAPVHSHVAEVGASDAGGWRFYSGSSF